MHFISKNTINNLKWQKKIEVASFYLVDIYHEWQFLWLLSNIIKFRW